MPQTYALRQFTVQTWERVMPFPERLWMRGHMLRRRHLHMSKHWMTFLSCRSANQTEQTIHSIYFAHHLRSVTPDFLEAEHDVKDKVQVTRGSRKDDQCERQGRRWASRMMSDFKEVLAQRGPDLESNFLLLMKSRFFQAEFGGLLDFEYSHCSPVIDGLVHEYKRAIGKDDSKMARHVLSHVAPFYTRWKVMMLFGCSEWAVKAARLLHRFRRIPASRTRIHLHPILIGMC